MATKKSASKSPKRSGSSKKTTKKAPAKKAAKKSVKKAPAKKAAGKKRVPAKKKPAKKPAASTAPFKEPKAWEGADRPSSDRQWPTIILAIAAIIVLGVAAFLIYQTFSAGNPSTDTGDTGTPAEIDESFVAAEVYGFPVTVGDVRRQYEILPTKYRATYTPEVVLDQLVNEQIIMHYGAENGIDATPEEINNEIQNVLDTGQITIEDLQKNLAANNMTIPEFEELISRKLIIQKSMELLLADVQPATAEEIETYYTEHQEEFAVPEQVRARHILLMSTRDNAAQLGKELMERVQDGEDFCELVTEYSDDKGSLETCGEYTFPRGMMVPEFENAAFDMEDGDVTLVQTTFGYHVIEKLEHLPAHTMSLEEVSEQIGAALTRAHQTSTYEEFIVKERASDGVVIIGLSNETVQALTGAGQPAADEFVAVPATS